MPPVLAGALIAALGFAAAAATYLGVERLGRRGWLPLICRGVAWTALGLLLADLSCARREAGSRPLVLLDGSLSFTAPGAQWAAARDSARRWGEVRLFGDQRPFADTLPDRGRSLLAPELTAAAAGARPLIVVSDGEIDDAGQLPPALLDRTTVRLFPRHPRPDLAITRAEAPARATQGDTLAIEAELQAFAGYAADSATVEVRVGDRRLLRRRTALRSGAARLSLAVPLAGLPAGDQVIDVALAAPGDSEPRTDLRRLVVRISATPGVVLLASPGDWDSRFLFRTLRDVAQLPVRGYVRLQPGNWRDMRSLVRVPEAQVRRAAAGADLLILKGAAGEFARGAHPRARWNWPSGEAGGPLLGGDWYLSAGSASPLAAAFLGASLDSFPPVSRVVPLQPGAESWIALSGREGRQGAARPLVAGRATGATRELTVAADGFWRWAFRGGASQQVYRSFVASAVSWLLAGSDSAAGRARVVRPSVPAGQAVVFQWTGGSVPSPLAVRWAGAETGADTLRFDGEGRAEVWLPVGVHRYRLAGGGGGTVAVEPYSDELIPRSATLTPREATPESAGGRSRSRDWVWLFGLAVLGFSGEWLARRRLGLR